MPSSEYHLKQATIAARLALTESDKVKAAQLHLMALEQFDKAEKAKVSKQSRSRFRGTSGKDDDVDRA
jgi:conjugal transfer/entry exclusion protein